ncbi:hypothetical protein I4F81_000403 [Pyropia yezoensis]|uniref:Uncharacterized protein n=1 Tax=Pyropia yezoensis TaxID=2788 RepID=A0ACC3BJJ5_PYRYE|nr:hypothetical protein I4F81_000403 [Neopyropia yezoensis]
MMATSKKRRSGKAPAAGGGGSRIAARGFGGAPAAATGARPLQSGAYAALSRYLLAGAANVRRVAIADIPAPGGEGPPLRGVIATEAIPAGAVMCSLPRSLAVDLGSEGKNPGVVALELLRLMDGAAAGGGGGGRGRPLLAPVFDCLPALGSAEVLTPDWYTAEELDALEYRPVVTEVLARQQLLRSTYEDAVAADPAVADRLDRMGGYERYLWAVFIVVSRSYTIAEASGAPPRKYLLPLFDMANHHPASPHTMSCRGGSFQLVAGAPVAAGEEICLVYGGTAQLGNDRLLMDYGFVNTEDNFAADLRALLRGATHGRTKSQAVAAVGGAAAAAEEQLLETVRAVKGGFSTTLEADEARLAAGGEDLSPAMRQVLSFRVAMKRCLSQALRPAE